MPWVNPYPDTELNFLGIRIHRLAINRLVECFESALEDPGPLHFGYLNVAVSNLAEKDSNLTRLLNEADLVYVDGFGIRLGCWVLGHSCPPRTTAGDFLPRILEVCAQNGKSVGYLGGAPGSGDTLKDKMLERFPDLRICFVRDGYGELEEEESWTSALKTSPPDLLLVGLGVPKQEEFIEKCRNRFQVSLYWSVGALFEYDGGSLRRCPTWMRNSGLEWFHRLWTEPGRLWKRYLIGNPRFLLRCLSSRLRGRGATS